MLEHHQYSTLATWIMIDYPEIFEKWAYESESEWNLDDFLSKNYPTLWEKFKQSWEMSKEKLQEMQDAVLKGFNESDKNQISSGE